MLEPEYITIVEGPTPDFEAAPYLWSQSVYEGPMDGAVAQCELRTMNGEAILQRCEDAWAEGRPVLLDFPDDMRLRQEVDVIALRLHEREEGPALVLWVRWPLEEEDEEEENTYDE